MVSALFFLTTFPPDIFLDDVITIADKSPKKILHYFEIRKRGNPIVQASSPLILY